MPTSTNLEQEKSELQTVLSSATFAKSLNLAKILSYVCHEYFEGRASNLKEYRIAVEGMGRSPQFDPLTNSIVRVEMRRLREKLKKYYETEGASHSMIIKLESGHYVPEFVKQDHRGPKVSQINELSVTLNIPEVTTDRQAPRRKVSFSENSNSTVSDTSLPSPRANRLRPAIGSGFLFLVALTTAVWKPSSLERRGVAVPIASLAEERVAATSANGQTIRILAGFTKGEHIDRRGYVWGSDHYFAGGVAGSQPREFIDRTLDPTLFQTFRRGEFVYDIPLKIGTYELRLYFVETFFGPGTILGTGEGNRVFDIDMNGKPLLTDFDIIRDAGSNKAADVRVFKDVTPAPDGYLHLKFRRISSEPIVNAIEIVPGTPGRLRPIRMVARDSSYTDHEGNVWLPDNYFSGGRLAQHKGPVRQTADPDLYTMERFGSFSYSIPVSAEGEYAITLRFAETFFGPANTGKGKGGVGSRVFDVYCDGTTLLRNFDIFKEVGGANRALDKTFHGLKPNAESKLVLTFVPVKNYASVNAIEVIDESR